MINRFERKFRKRPGPSQMKNIYMHQEICMLSVTVRVSARSVDEVVVHVEIRQIWQFTARTTV